MGFRNCVFFAFCIIKVRCRVDIAMHARLLNTKYTLFTAFHTLIREREDYKYVRWVNVYNYKNFHEKWVP